MYSPGRTGIGRCRRERGSATLELAVLMPVVLVLVFVAMQAALVYYGRALAMAAAQEGLRATRGLDGSQPAGARAATTYLNEVAGDALADPRISIARTTWGVRVEITGRTLSVIPGLHGTSITQVAHGPWEEYTSP